MFKLLTVESDTIHLLNFTNGSYDEITKSKWSGTCSTTEDEYSCTTGHLSISCSAIAGSIFTIECLFKGSPTSYECNQICYSSNPNSVCNGIGFSTTQVNYDRHRGTSSSLIYNHSDRTNWHRYCLTVNGKLCTLFIDGIKVAEGESGSSATQTPNFIEAHSSYGTGFFANVRISNTIKYTSDYNVFEKDYYFRKIKYITKGKIDEFKISKSKSNSNSLVTPALIVDDRFTCLLLHFNESVSKDECNNKLSVSGSLSLSESNAKFNKACYFNGSSFLKLTNGITLGGQDFTTDFWAYPIKNTDNNNPWRRFFSFSEGAGDSMGVGQGFHIDLNNNNNTLRFDLVKGTNMSMTYLDQLAHYAIVYNYNLKEAKAYINGICQMTIENVDLPRIKFPIAYIGQYNGNNGNYYFHGYISEFRISDGIMRWTSDFTPPDSPYGNFIGYSSHYVSLCFNELTERLK